MIVTSASDKVHVKLSGFFFFCKFSLGFLSSAEFTSRKTDNDLLPAATKLWPRLCFYTCLWFCSQGGSLAGRTPPPGAGRTPPGADPPPPPGSRLRHTVNERPVRILLVCILVLSYFHWELFSKFPDFRIRSLIRLVWLVLWNMYINLQAICAKNHRWLFGKRLSFWLMPLILLLQAASLMKKAHTINWTGKE